MSLLFEFSDVSLGYARQQPVLEGVNLKVQRGAYLGIVGPNGSGKTTVLRALLGLLSPLSGRLSVAAGLRAGYVPQRETVDTLFPLPVEDIVLMGRYGRIGPVRRPGRTDRRVVLECLEQVGIANLRRRNYSEMSGGQKQRALIARALATQPDVLVLDEPTNGMDLVSEQGLLALIGDLHQRDRMSVILVSHLLSNVANVAPHIAIIAGGRLDEGPRDEMLTPQRLERLYGIPVGVHRIGGKYAILAGDAPV